MSAARTTADALDEADDIDLAVVTGRLSRDPVVTTLPSGSTLHRYEVTSRHAGGTDTVPVAWFDARRPPALSAGDPVTVVGRVHRRFFRAGGVTRSSTEVLASSVTKRGSRVRAVAAIEEALATLSS